MRNISLALCLLMMTAGLSGCIGGNGTEISTEGDSIEQGELLDDWPTYSVPTSNDLPVCDSSTLGRLYYVESPAEFQVCKSTGWAVLDLSQLGVLQNSIPAMSIISHSTSPVNDNDGTWSASVELEVLALDVDGHVSSLGVDLDLDGTVDLDFTTTLGLGANTANPAQMSIAFSMPYEQFLHVTRESAFSNYCHLQLSNVFAVMIEDDDGAIQTELMTVYPNNDLLGTFSTMVNGFNSYGIFDTLQLSPADRAWVNGSDPSSPCAHLPEFTITDHTDPLTTATDDNLVRVEITSANDIASLMSAGSSFTPGISEPAYCPVVVTFDGTDENNPQTGDAWILSEATNNTNAGLCAPNSPSTVVVQFGASGVGPYTMAYQEVVVS